MASHSLRLLFLSTSVGPLGSGLGGGVELTLQNIAQALIQRGHRVVVAAPVGSVAGDLVLVQIPGNLQVTAQSQTRDAVIAMPPNSVLANLWEYARQVQQDYDLLVNFAYDWLPFYLTPFFSCPVAHLVSMGSLSEAMDQVIGETLKLFPEAIAVHSRAQAETFPFADQCRVLGNGLDLSLYQFCDEPADYLGWVGRIAPEKGLEDAIAAVNQVGTPLRVWGAMPDKEYWDSILQKYSGAPVQYEGFLPTEKLQQALGRCRALLMTPHWVEAFGNVAIEALACGVPVIAYRRGGPAEIVQDGKTGWLVEPDSVVGLVGAIAKVNQLNRWDCRQQAEAQYSLAAMGDRVERWFCDILQVNREGDQSIPHAPIDGKID